MPYSTTLNQKSQVTLQKNIRQKYKLGPASKVKVVEKDTHIEIWPQKTILTIAGKIKAPKGKSSLDARLKHEEEHTRT
jgi:bifunctional DNA-binding transcriptional regulator/antitoxin component of YhaV-PrlF toxin-antitoxin module